MVGHGNSTAAEQLMVCKRLVMEPGMPSFKTMCKLYFAGWEEYMLPNHGFFAIIVCIIRKCVLAQRL